MESAAASKSLPSGADAILHDHDCRRLSLRQRQETNRGIGAEKLAKSIEIRWPSGAVQHFDNVSAGKWIDAVEPSS